MKWKSGPCIWPMTYITSATCAKDIACTCRCLALRTRGERSHDSPKKRIIDTCMYRVNLGAYCSTSVYLKVGLVPWRELMERGRSLSCLKSWLSSVNTSITFLLASSPVEHTHLWKEHTLVVPIKTGPDEQKITGGGAGGTLTQCFITPLS